MRKVLLISLAVFMLSGCAQSSGDALPTQSQQASESVVLNEMATKTAIPSGMTAPADSDSFDGKIAFITETIDMNMENYCSVEEVQSKYGDNKITHATWPVGAVTDHEFISGIVNDAGDDSDVEALILNTAIPGANQAIDKLDKINGNAFTIFITPIEHPKESVKRADLLLVLDELYMGVPIVQQAHKMGAKTFVHYSFDRHMTQWTLSKRREMIKKECEKFDISFVDATALDPTSEVGTEGARQFILEDVPKMVAQYGKDTAFFVTNCVLQAPLIKAVVNEGAIYPQPCHPSPYHGFPDALDLPDELDKFIPADEMIGLIREKLAAKNMLGRVSTWPVPSSMMFTDAAVEYAIKWINGEVPREGIDVEVLTKLMEDYAGIPVYLTPYTDPETGETYKNYLMMRMDYITFE